MMKVLFSPQGPGSGSLVSMTLDPNLQRGTRYESRIAKILIDFPRCVWNVRIVSKGGITIISLLDYGLVLGDGRSDQSTGWLLIIKA